MLHNMVYSLSKKKKKMEKRKKNTYLLYCHQWYRQWLLLMSSPSVSIHNYKYSIVLLFTDPSRQCSCSANFFFLSFFFPSAYITLTTFLIQFRLCKLRRKKVFSCLSFTAFLIDKMTAGYEKRPKWKIIESSLKCATLKHISGSRI